MREHFSTFDEVRKNLILTSWTAWERNIIAILAHEQRYKYSKQTLSNQSQQFIKKIITYQVIGFVPGIQDWVTRKNINWCKPQHW